MFYWDKKVRKFRDDNGRIISDDRLRRYIDAVCSGLAIVFIARAERLRNHFTADNFGIWNTQTRIDLMALHYAMMIMAFGGQSEMSAPQWTKAEDRIKFHAGFFDSFASDVITGKVEMNGNFPVRTSLYALGGYSTYDEGVRLRETDEGMTEEKRNTTSGNPCTDCETAAGLGWSPIGSLPDIGDSVCITRCRCYFLFR